MNKFVSQIERFEEDGYLIIPDILAKNQITELQRLCKKIYFETNNPEVFSSRFLREPLLAEIPFQDNVISLLKELMGASYITYPNFTVRNNVYVPWHVDNGFLQASRDIKKALFIQCAIYLQDNSSIYGGGLDVVPKSQFYQYSIDASELIQRTQKNIRLDSKAGDLVIWDSRLLHRSTQPQLAGTTGKFGIHWTVSKEDAPVEAYLRHLVGRATRNFEGQNYDVARFSDIKKIKFSDSFLQNTVNKIISDKLRIESVSDIS